MCVVFIILVADEFMIYIAKILLITLMLASCAFNATYDQELSVKNAQEKIEVINQLVKKAQANNKDYLSQTYRQRGCSSKGSFGLAPSDNFARASYDDFERVLRENFLVLRKLHYPAGAIAYYRDAWKTHFIVGDGSVIISQKVDVDNGTFRSGCGGGAFGTDYAQTISVSSNDNTRPINESSFLNRDPDKVDENEFIKSSETIDSYAYWDNIEYEDRMAERSHYNRVEAQYRAKKQEERAQRDAEHFIELQNKVKSNMKFFSGNTKYIEQQDEINKNKNNASSKYEPSMSYTSLQTSTPKMTNIHQAYYYNGILEANKSIQENGISYYRESSQAWPKEEFNSCNEKFVPVAELESKYRGECKSRFGSSEIVISQCASQGAAKARNTFLQRYKSWFGRKCPEIAAGKSFGDNDYEK